MKRDMTLVREILLAVEAFPEGSGWVDIRSADHSAEEISYHVKIMSEGG
jgi:hypothetical protein